MGILLGYGDWFIPKTPLNLIIAALLFLVIYPVDTAKKIGLFFGCFLVGMSVEWIGVHTGVLFGTYSYGENLGLKFDGVPYLIGVYWALLTFICGEIAKQWISPAVLQIALASALMVLLDFFMEHSAPTFDFWTFENGVPLKNYVTWYVVAVVLQTLFNRLKIEGNTAMSYHLFAAQLVFFGVLYFF